MQTVAVSIGRNIGNEPLPPHAWDRFRDETYSVIENNAEAVFSVAQGTGVWEDVAEDTFVILFQVKGEHVSGLRGILARIAGKYGQEALGFTAAPSQRALLKAVI